MDDKRIEKWAGTWADALSNKFQSVSSASLAMAGRELIAEYKEKLGKRDAPLRRIVDWADADARSYGSEPFEEILADIRRELSPRKSESEHG